MFQKGIAMETKKFLIGSIPSVLYGDSGERCYLFLHGQMGYKEEAEAFAQVVCPKGYQVLAIDLPGHGDRQNRGEELVPWTAVPDIQSAWDWAKGHWDKVALRATSIGAYFALACLDSPSQALLVSPILNMEQLILTMMDWVGVTEEQLREQGKIATSFGQTLSWKYLCWVREHPVRDWKCPVCLLYGSKDNMTPRQIVETYAQRSNVHLTVVEGGEHWFHTSEQLTELRKWEEQESRLV